MTPHFTPERYEAALLERLTQEFPPPRFEVKGTVGGRQHRVVGRYSKWRRQLDGAVHRAGATAPFLVADAKRRATRRIGLSEVESFIGLLDDIDCKWGVVTSPLGPTEPARRRAAFARVKVEVMTYEEALQAEWLPTARQIYPWDWAFHPHLASALAAIHDARPCAEVADALEQIPFEEWQRFVYHALSQAPHETLEFLDYVARNHHDSGWRYNAVQVLLRERLLDTSTADHLRKTELDREILDLLEEA